MGRGGGKIIRDVEAGEYESGVFGDTNFTTWKTWKEKVGTGHRLLKFVVTTQNLLPAVLRIRIRDPVPF
jgi:hypothetical protein